MSKKFVEKNIKLSLEFDKYISRHPSAYKKIPHGSCIVFSVKGDEEFNKNSRMLVGEARQQNQKCIEVRKDGARWML